MALVKSEKEYGNQFYKDTYPSHAPGRPPSLALWSILGGDKQDRTDDLVNAIQARAHLSYTPSSFFEIKKFMVFIHL